MLPKTKKGNIGVLVAVDHCSKWLQVVPIKNKTGKTVANAMRRQIIPNLVRVPDAVLSDNGREFTAEDFNTLPAGGYITRSSVVRENIYIYIF